MKQIPLLKKSGLAYGGSLLKTRKGRAHGRPLDTRNTMHLVLRSSKARGVFSFLKSGNHKTVRDIVDKFARKYSVTILSLGNAGNHLHLHIKLAHRHSYRPFIRATTAAIAMAITGASRWHKSKIDGKFWDYRPFTRIVVGLAAFRYVRDYVQVNVFEGLGADRLTAYLLVKEQRLQPMRC